MADSGTPAFDVARLQRIGEGRFPGHLGIEVLEQQAGRLRAALPVRNELLAPNGYLHAGAIVTLADTAAAPRRCGTSPSPRPTTTASSPCSAARN
jgi:uncharacterized protein (TIGR00369 family)